MDKRTISAIIGGVIAFIIIIAILAGGVGKNDAQNWQIIQSVGGKITVRDQAGWYPKWFATVWTFPRYVDKSWNDVEDEGEKTIESIRTTFNDGGTAQVSTYVRYATPTSEEERIEFHRQFSGNVENATIAVKSHQINCIKATGPLMSASENQSARKAEFTQLIEAQLSDGLYQMKRMEREVEVEKEEEESAVRLKQITTELVCDKDGKPLIAKDSPLDFYGIKILQFSVTGTDYDPDTLQQFATKKRSFLAAEQSKADREKEKQERLNIIEKGLREVAEAQAAANVVKEKAVVEAQQKVEVALQTKLEAETTAEMALSVATIAKQEASVKFSKAEIDAKAITVLAQAERERIKLAGALTELEQAKIDAQVQMATEVAAGLAQIQVPSVMIMGGNGTGDGSDLMKNLINLKLMADSGILRTTDISNSVVEREVNREDTTDK